MSSSNRYHLSKSAVAFLATVCVVSVTSLVMSVESPPGESPALEGPRIAQQQIVDDLFDLDELRLAGLRMFTTPFNKLDGHGDGPMDPADPVTPGGRPTLQGNGTFLRVNGLDSQTCLECHSILSTATAPPRLGIGGVGSASTNAVIMPTLIDMADPGLDGTAVFNGRFANPPFLFGAGAVELLAQEMTADLQSLKQQALSSPGTTIDLVTKNVSFGSVVAEDAVTLNLDDVVGVSDDLVVRPFGRKGEFFSIRDFDIGAMQFHFGMQPIEVVGGGSDGDGDGVIDEILAGELSALSIFIAKLERPFGEPLTDQTAAGFEVFQEVGCATCHIPALQTTDTQLGLRFPEVPTDPQANVFYEVDLSTEPTSFPLNTEGGISVPLFADLKRHDMGPDLAESFALVDAQTNREFTTARLWGVADTAPYLHDGRATTLTEAILLHGGEGQAARDAFDSLAAESRTELLAFLRSLRTPANPTEALLADAGADDDDENDDEDGDDGGIGNASDIEITGRSGGGLQGLSSGGQTSAGRAAPLDARTVDAPTQSRERSRRTPAGTPDGQRER